MPNDDIIRSDTSEQPLTGDAPICPGCGAVATRQAFGWVTEHDIDCSWLSDPDSEPYS